MNRHELPDSGVTAMMLQGRVFVVSGRPDNLPTWKWGHFYRNYWDGQSFVTERIQL